MNVTQLIEKLSVVALVAVGLTLTSCEKTMEGVSKDADKAKEALEGAGGKVDIA